MRVRLFLFLAVVAATGCDVEQGGTTVVYAVRHAEREEDGTRDPPLSADGLERAEVLATMLADAKIDRVLTSGFKRTRQTAAPLVDRATLALETYDPSDLPSLVDELRQAPGRYVVFGHSNTTPELVRLLGGDPGTPIDEGEYDRLYVVVLPPTGPPVSILLRFGEPFGGHLTP